MKKPKLKKCCFQNKFFNLNNKMFVRFSSIELFLYKYFFILQFQFLLAQYVLEAQTEQLQLMFHLELLHMITPGQMGKQHKQSQALARVTILYG